MIAPTPPCWRARSARRCAIYDRHEDLSATTKRYPAVVHHRTGVMRDGRLVAQEIDVVMDGGAYCTLTPVVLSRGVLHAAGPYRCPNVRISGRSMATNTPPNGAFRNGARRPSSLRRCRSTASPRRSGYSARAAPPMGLPRGDETPTGQVLRESVAAVEVLEAAEAADFSRHAEQTRRAREARQSGARLASGIGMAMGWHGAGFTGSGEVHIAGVAAVELTDEGAVRVLSAQTEMGQGTKTIFPAAGGRGARSRTGGGGGRAAGHQHRSRPAQRSRRGRRWWWAD